jgi:hypothetical protein
VENGQAADAAGRAGRPNDVEIPDVRVPDLDRLSDRPVGRDQCATAGRLGIGQFELGQRGVVGEQPLAAAAGHEGLIIRVSSSSSPWSISEALGSMTELKGHDLDSWEAAHPSRPSPACMMDSLKGSS